MSSWGYLMPGVEFSGLGNGMPAENENPKDCLADCEYVKSYMENFPITEGVYDHNRLECINIASLVGRICRPDVVCLIKRMINNDLQFFGDDIED